jgi:DNA-binding response OmpR family regulator
MREPILPFKPVAIFDYFKKRSAAAEPVVASDKPVERRRRPRGRVPDGASVLIIDDSKTMVAALGRMLRENQFTILEAFDGESGLELLQKNKPSLIFLDIILPGVSGFDVLRRIRRSQYVGKVPVIVMSGNEAATEEYYVRRIGADDFMRKPCSRAEVFSRVERLLDLTPNALTTTSTDSAEMLPHDVS